LGLSQLDEIAGLAGRQKRRKFKRMRRNTAEKLGAMRNLKKLNDFLLLKVLTGKRNFANR
jgi:hypothetical protein